jgi:hypothetical protein
MLVRRWNLWGIVIGKKTFSVQNILMAMFNRYIFLLKRRVVALIGHDMALRVSRRSFAFLHPIDAFFAYVRSSKNPCLSSAVSNFIDDVVRYCVRSGVVLWVKYVVDYYRTGREVYLFDMLKICVLSRSGDCQSYVVLYKRLLGVFGIKLSEHISDSNFLYYLAESFISRSAILLQKYGWHENKIARDNFSICMSVWGDAYLDKFFKWFIPSLKAEGNIEHLLSKHNVFLLLFTDRYSLPILERNEDLVALRQMGVNIVFELIEERLWLFLANNSMNSEFKYWHLGCCESLGILFAKITNSDFHQAFPDMVYCKNYFKNMLTKVEKEDGDVVIQSCFSISEKAFLKASGCSRDVIFSDWLDAEEFCYRAVKSFHPSTCNFVMNGLRHFPLSHYFMLDMGDCIKIFSAHQNLFFMSKRCVMSVGGRYFETLDSSLERIVPDDCRVLCSEYGDGLFVVGIENSGGEDVHYSEDYGCSLVDWSSYWTRAIDRKCMRFLALPTCYKYSDYKLKPTGKFFNNISDKEIKDAALKAVSSLSIFDRYDIDFAFKGILRVFLNKDFVSDYDKVVVQKFVGDMDWYVGDKMRHCDFYEAERSRFISGYLS